MGCGGLLPGAMPNGSESADGETEKAWNEGQSTPDGEGQSGANEAVEAEVVGHNPALTPEVEALSTFSEQEGPLSFRILPVIEGGQTDWRILVYMRGVQGPVYQSRDGLTNGAAGQFGISSMLQERVNDALRFAKDNLEVPPELGDQKRQKRTLHELEILMQEQG